MPDYSSYITIKNNLDCSLTFVNYGADHGNWEMEPPATINPGRVSRQFQLKDSWGPYGTDGWVRYRVDLADAADDESKPVIRVHFADPTGNYDNEFNAWATTKDGSSASCYLFAFTNTDYPKRDHPLTVTLTIDYNAALTTASQVTSISVPNPAVSVRNTEGVVHMGSNLVVWKSASPGDYEDDSDPQVAGSFYPVAVNVASPPLMSAAMDVYVNVADQMLGVPFILYGGNDVAGNVVSSDPSQPLMFYTAGTQRIRVSVSPSWANESTPWAVVGNITWRLKVSPTGQVIGINSARLEFYAIAKSLPNFYRSVVNVTLLRRFVVPLRDSATSWVDHCCKQTFTNFSFRYDSYYGAPKYVSTMEGGSFKLGSYLRDIGTRTVLNCYDQAGIMQICLGLSPATNGAGYVYMRKFGWTVTTELVGRGQCNNPFYLNNAYNSSIVCGNDDSNRSAFANHAFVSLKPSAKIVDTCCGYHNGTLTLQEYITAAVQTEADTTLYRSTGKTPGTANDADFNVSGITDLTGATSLTAMPISARIAMAPAHVPAVSSILPDVPVPFPEDVANMLELATVVDRHIPERRSNAALSDFFTPATLTPLGWRVSRPAEITASAAGTDAEWVLTTQYDDYNDDDDDGGGGSDNDDGGDITVSIFLSSGGLRGATLALGTHLGTYSQALGDVFRAGGVRGQLNLESAPQDAEGYAGERLILLWVYGNVFVRIAHRSDDGDRDGDGSGVRGLADALHRFIEQGARPVDAEDVLAPRIRGLRGPTGPVAVGETFVVSASLEGGSVATVDCKAGHVVLMEHNKAEGSFRFYAARPGNETISFCFAHRSTLNSAVRELDVTVMET